MNRTTDPKLIILMVDDDLNDLSLLTQAIDTADLNIWLPSVFNVQGAIAYLEGKGHYADRSLHPLPDLVLLDLKMQGYSGFDFLAWRNTSSAFSSLPVVCYTGLGDEREIQRALAMGASRCLTKPHSFEALKRVAFTLWEWGMGLSDRSISPK